jgi:hypothetical protein
MRNYKKILAILLLPIIVITSFTGCGKGNENVDIYSKLQELSNTEKFDFEVNASFQVKKTENVEIETSTSTTAIQEITPMTSTKDPLVSNEGTTEPSEVPTENKVTNDTTKTEVVTTETDYNLRLIGTYLGQEQWFTKVFIKDASTKGYTNITNIYRKDKDIYVDAYSMIDSLDFLLDANGALLNQFDFSKGNIVKTNIKTLLAITKSENTNRNSQLPDIIKVISTDLCDIIEKAGYDTSVIDSAFDSAVEIAKEVSHTIENETNKTDGEKEKDKELFSFTSKDETGAIVFTLDESKSTTKQFIKTFGETLNKDLLTKMQTTNTNEENKKEDSTTTVSPAVKNFVAMDNNWIKDYGTEIAKITDDTKVNFSNSFNILDKEGKRTTNIVFSYNKENENLTQTTSVNIKINETTAETIEMPTKIITDTNINKLHETAKTHINSFLLGNLENEDSDMTPEKMISVGKLIKPSQNDDFKYKIFDKYIAISEYIGKGTTVSIPDTIEGLPVFVIEEAAFSSNTNITSVTIPDSVVQIKKSAFENCENLNTLTLSKNLNDIPDYMCNECINLKNIEIPYGVKSIGASAFKNCESFTEIVVPSTVSNIGIVAFANCKNVKTIVIMDGTLYDENGTYIKTIGLNIESSAFSGHRAKTIVIPQTVLSIDTESFTPDYQEKVETMYYGYSPSELNELCAKQKYLFTSISAGEELDKALKSDMEQALNIAKSF